MQAGHMYFQRRLRLPVRGTALMEMNDGCLTEIRQAVAINEVKGEPYVRSCGDGAARLNTTRGSVRGFTAKRETRMGFIQTSGI